MRGPPGDVDERFKAYKFTIHEAFFGLLAWVLRGVTKGRSSYE
jgi:hypothetical protein